MSFLKKFFEKRAKEVEYVRDVFTLLDEFPEYREAKRRKQGPMLFTGGMERFTGRIAFTELTGGTEGAQEVYEKLSQAGVGTLLSMHLTEDRKDEAEKHHLNVVVAGHMSSDSIGMNLFLDELEKRGVEIVPVGGFIRTSRNRSRRVSPSGAKKASSKSSKRGS
jgi:hypothetical protein